MQNPGLNASLAHLNSLVEAQVAETANGGASYLSSVPSLGDARHGYTPYVAGPSGAITQIRTPDGIHLTPGGGARLAAAVVTAMQDQLHVALVPAVNRIGHQA